MQRSLLVYFAVWCLALVGRGTRSAEQPPEDLAPLKQLLGKTEPAMAFEPKDFPERGQLMEAVRGLGERACEVLCRIMLDTGETLEVRRGAAWVMGELNDKRAVGPLMKMFGETPYALPDTAAKALGKIDAPDLVPQLLALYLGGEEETNAWAGRCLQTLKRPSYVKELLPLLKHKEEKVRATAARGLGSIGDRGAVAGLVGSLDDGNDGVVMFAAQSLGQIGAAEALGPLNTRFGKGGDVFLKRYLMDAIQAIRDRQGADWATRQGIKPGRDGVAALVTALKDKDESVRRSAAAELAKRAEDAAEAGPALVEALGDPDEIVGKTAIEALVEIGAPSAVPLLGAILKGPGKGRSKGIATLFRLIAKRDREVIPALRPFVKDLAGLLEDKEAAVAQSAVTLLGMLGPDAAPAIPRILRKLGDPTLGPPAAVTLGGIGEKAVPDLVEALKDENRLVRALAAFALGQVGVDSRIVLMMSVAYGAPPDAEAMDHFRIGRNATQAVPALMGLIKDSDPGVRLMAIASLGRMKGDAREAVPLLEEAAKDKDANMQKAAQRALKQIQAALEKPIPESGRPK